MSSPPFPVPAPSIWYIAPDGANLEDTVACVRASLERDALPWFERFTSPESFLELLLTSEEYRPEDGWGYGAKDSPRRHYLIGYMATKFGDNDMAMAHLQAYVKREKELNMDGMGVGSLFLERVESDVAAMKSHHGAPSDALVTPGE